MANAVPNKGFIMFPIYICSKGRPTLPVLKLLPKERVKVVVEPQDFRIYEDTNPGVKILKLPYNDKGLSFARQCALEHARNKKHPAYWMIDDDIEKFYIGMDPVPFLLVETIASNFMFYPDKKGELKEVKIVALSNRENAHNLKGFITRDYACDACILIHNPTINYNTNLKIYADKEFTIRTIRECGPTVTLNRIFFKTPPTGELQGGQLRTYTRENRIKYTKMMACTYPNCCFQLTPDSEYLHINWEKVKE